MKQRPRIKDVVQINYRLKSKGNICEMHLVGGGICEYKQTARSTSTEGLSRVPSALEGSDAFKSLMTCA